LGRVVQPPSSPGLPVPPPPDPPPRPPKRHKHHPTTMPSTRTVTPVPSPVDSLSSPDVLASLGKLIRDHSNLFKTLGWQRFITTLQQPRDTASYLHRLPHPAAPFLHRISSVGIPAPSSSAPPGRCPANGTTTNAAPTTRHQPSTEPSYGRICSIWSRRVTGLSYPST